MPLSKVALKYKPEDVKLNVVLEDYRNAINSIIDNINTDTSSTDLGAEIDALAASIAAAGYLKADGTVPLTANWNAGSKQISLGTKFIGTTTKARAYRNASQLDITRITWVKVLLNAESYDEGNNFADYKFVAPVNGMYLVNAAVCWDDVVDLKLYAAAIYKNGAAYSIAYSHSSLTNYVSNTISDILPLSISDYVELYAYHTAGAGTADVYGTTDGRHTYMSVHLISL